MGLAPLRRLPRHGLPRTLLLLTALSLLHSCNVAPKGDWRIEPRKRAGALLPTGSEEELRKAYGDENVETGRIELGEGESTIGTILFPADTVRRLEIVWQDSLHRAIPARIFLRGGRSLWRFPRDVTLGTPLTNLEKANERPFTLAGFAWDYEGVVISWDGGALDTALTSDVKVYLKPSPADRDRPEYSRALGDKPYPSSLPEMRALNPRVYQILLDFEHLPSPGESAHSPEKEITEADAGKTFTFDPSSRFMVILDERKHPQRTLTSTPRGILGRVSNVPDVALPLYAAMFEAVGHGEAVITAKGFSVKIVVRENAGSSADSSTANP